MSPPSLAARRGQSGGGSAPRSLSRAGIRRLKGRQLPDAILHGKRSYRPHSRAVQRLAATRFRAGPLSSLGLAVAPPAREPGENTAVTSVRVSTPWHQDGPRLWRGVGPVRRVWPLIPQIAFGSQASGTLGVSPTFWKVSQSLPSPVSLPLRMPALSTFRCLSPSCLRPETAGHSAACWCAVAIVHPPGDCDSPKPETSLGYLTRLRAASHRPSPLGFQFAF